jgi:hypothetical protein
MALLLKRMVLLLTRYDHKDAAKLASSRPESVVMHILLHGAITDAAAAHAG